MKAEAALSLSWQPGGTEHDDGRWTTRRAPGQGSDLLRDPGGHLQQRSPDPMEAWVLVAARPTPEGTGSRVWLKLPCPELCPSHSGPVPSEGRQGTWEGEEGAGRQGGEQRKPHMWKPDLVWVPFPPRARVHSPGTPPSTGMQPDIQLFFCGPRPWMV